MAAVCIALLCFLRRDIQGPQSATHPPVMSQYLSSFSHTRKQLFLFLPPLNTALKSIILSQLSHINEPQHHATRGKGKRNPPKPHPFSHGFHDGTVLHSKIFPLRKRDLAEASFCADCDQVHTVQYWYLAVNVTPSLLFSPPRYCICRDVCTTSEDLPPVGNNIDILFFFASPSAIRTSRL